MKVSVSKSAHGDGKTQKNPSELEGLNFRGQESTQISPQRILGRTSSDEPGQKPIMVLFSSPAQSDVGSERSEFYPVFSLQILTNQSAENRRTRPLSHHSEL